MYRLSWEVARNTLIFKLDTVSEIYAYDARPIYVYNFNNDAMLTVDTTLSRAASVDL